MRKQLIIAITPAEHSEIKSTAAKQGISITRYVRLKLGLDKEKK